MSHRKHRRILILATLLSTLGLAMSTNAAASGRVFAHGTATTAEGGRTSATLSGARNPAGGTFVHGRTSQSDGNGNASTRSGTAFRTRNGGTGTRTGSTSRNADGSLSHQGEITASGARGGSIQSEGGFTRNANDVNTRRSTTATSPNGTTYQGSTTYDKENGISHSATCTDSTGNTVACR